MPTATAVEFPASSILANAQTPSVAGLSDGGFVVVWRNDENGGDVKAQLFAADGSNRGAEFRVSVATAGAQTSPSVAALDTGGFLVAWNAGGDVKSQVFDLAGQKVGAEFTVDLPDYPAQPTAGQYLADASPEVVDVAGDGYALAWSIEDRNVNTTPAGVGYNTNSSKVQIQLVANSGAGRGGPINATDFMPFRTAVHVAGMTSGGFYLTYTRVQDIGTQFYVSVVQVRDAAGALTGGPADTPIGVQAAIAGLSTGGFVLIGQPATRSAFSMPGPLRAVVGSNAGTTTGRTDTDIQMTNPAVAGNATGFSLAVFEVAGASTGRDIAAQLFDPTSNRVGAVTLVNTTTAGDQLTPDVAFLTGGRAVVVWRDVGTGAIRGQVLAITPPT